MTDDGLAVILGNLHKDLDKKLGTQTCPQCRLAPVDRPRPRLGCSPLWMSQHHQEESCISGHTSYAPPLQGDDSASFARAGSPWPLSKAKSSMSRCWFSEKTLHIQCLPPGRLDAWIATFSTRAGRSFGLAIRSNLVYRGTFCTYVATILRLA
jgi:hypothetical protein